VSGRESSGGPEPVRTVDQGFVAASPEQVFEVLREPAGYPAWWPGARSDGDGRLRLPGLPPATVATDGVRPGVGLFVRLDGRTRSGRRVTGHVEWYLEAFKEGTVVSGIANLDTGRPWSRRRVLRFRAGMRDGLVALRERLS
jgi:hypothetical protein